MAGIMRQRQRGRFFWQNLILNVWKFVLCAQETEGCEKSHVHLWCGVLVAKHCISPLPVALETAAGVDVASGGVTSVVSL